MEAVIVLVTATVALTTALVGFFTSLKAEIREISVNVDGRLSEALARIDQLDKALVEAGVVRPNKPPRDWNNKK